MESGIGEKVKPHDAATIRIIDLINKKPDYSFSDVRGIIGEIYPRRLAKGEKFNYITDRIIEEYVIPKLLNKDQRTALREKKIIYGKELLHNARIDDLTGLFRRGYFIERTKEEIVKSPKMKIVMADLDNFKPFNDKYGHPKGDEVLREFGNLMRIAFTNHEIFCRWGGEEFVMAVPDYVQDFEEKLDNFRRNFRSAVDAMIPNNSTEFKGTLSMGVYNADFSKGNLSLDEAIEFADQAAYKAKETRDSVVVWTPDLTLQK